MTRVFFILSIVSFCLLTGFSFFIPSPQANLHSSGVYSATNSINITLTDQNAPAINPGLYGFSADNLYNEIDDIYDTAFTAGVQQLSPKIIRWPGGFGSNFTHALENGYGY